VNDILGITLRVAALCERLGLRYVVGGSLASSAHGIPRATQDADFVIAMAPGDVRAFAAALRGEFYLDEGAIGEAVAQRTSFNIVHLGSYFKVDVFVAKDDEPSRLQFARSQRYAIAGEQGGELVVASPEDVVAQKLFWYALGGRVSERQWSDALGVLQVAGPRLDVEYMRHVASLLGVGELFEEAWRASSAK
jgi:hypothetical protein